MARAVEEATKEVLRRTGGAGFPLLCGGSSQIDVVKMGVEIAGATALVYHFSSLCIYLCRCLDLCLCLPVDHAMSPRPFVLSELSHVYYIALQCSKK